MVPRSCHRRRGVILPVMLFILILLGVLAASFAFRVHADRSAMNAVTYRMHTRLAAESGIQKVLLVLRTERNNVRAWYNNPEEFNRIIVWTPGDETLWGSNEELEEDAFAYRFSLVADQPYDDEERCRYGITDESAKLNINTATGPQLRRLIGKIATQEMIVEELVDALLDWRDQDDTPREFGAESQYYAMLDTPYRPKNGPFDTVEELLMVKGFDGLVLYGEDQDRNGLLTPNEDDGDESFPEDDGDGELNRGLYPYITVLSRERGTDRENRPRVYLYGDPVQVRDQLSEFIDEPAKVDFIVQAVTPSGGSGDQPGEGDETDRQGEGADEEGESGDEGRGVRGEPGSAGEAGDRQVGDEDERDRFGPEESRPPRGQRKNDRRSQTIGPGGRGDETGGDEPDESDQSGEGGPGEDEKSGDNGGQALQMNSPADLLTADVGGTNPLTIDDLAVLMERTTTQDPLTAQEGLINVLTAPPQVLRCVDELPGEAIGPIMGARGELSEDEQFSTAWLVTHEILTLEQYQQVAPQITAGGVQFTIESLGYADHVGMVTRLQVIVEMRGPMAQVLYYRDLTSLGAVYPIREGEAEYGFGGQRG